VIDLDEDDTHEPRLSAGPTRPTSSVLDEIIDDDLLDEPSYRREKHPNKRPLTQGGIESKRNRQDSELELGTKASAAAELPSKPSRPHSARVVWPASSQESGRASKYISPTS